jgi:hypothetical protein
VRDGFGKLVMADGRVATGTWTKGVLSGEGTMTLESGAAYQGELKELEDGSIVPSGKGRAEMASQVLAAAPAAAPAVAAEAALVPDAVWSQYQGQWLDGTLVEIELATFASLNPLALC